MAQPGPAQTPHDSAVMDVLQAVRAFSDAMDRMHGGMKGDMDMKQPTSPPCACSSCGKAAARP